MNRLGWHFAFVGTFAMVGGAIRGFNLPLVLAGLITGTLLMHWRIGRRQIESLTIRRRLPEEAFVDQPFTVRFLVTNHNRFLASWLIRIDDAINAPVSNGSSIRPPTRLRRLRNVFQSQALESVTAACGLGKVGPRRTVATSYDVVATQRGRYTVGPSVISSGMPLGLMTLRRTDPAIASMVVYPRLYPLRRDWRRRLQSRSGGMSTTARRSGASEGDFFGLRSWQAGDSQRWIHWRTTARIDELAVRQFEQQRKLDLCILVDAYRPPHDSEDADEALELAISAAASLATRIAATPSNRIAIAIAAASPEIAVSGGPRDHVTQMLTLLADLIPVQNPSLLGAIDVLIRGVGKPQDLVVVSPRTIPPEGEEMFSLVGNRCSVRWLSAADGSIDLLLQRTGTAAVRNKSNKSLPVSPFAPRK